MNKKNVGEVINLENKKLIKTSIVELTNTWFLKTDIIFKA